MLYIYIYIYKACCDINILYANWEKVRDKPNTISLEAKYLQHLSAQLIHYIPLYIYIYIKILNHNMLYIYIYKACCDINILYANWEKVRDKPNTN